MPHEEQNVKKKTTNKMKLIPLTQDKFAIVDDDDYDYLMQWKWHATKMGRNYYATRNTLLSNSENKKRTRILMHRLITNAKTGMDVDHIDMDGLNNLKSNLRVVSRSENMMNKNIRSDALTSKYKGVCIVVSNLKDGGKTIQWRARVQKNGKRLYSKCFNKESDAALEYNTMCVKLYGKTARLNNINK